ncbi:MAG: hypothetical protein IKL55_02655 [Clostridia bacterium]|nr:hypothetical protein [Clostridia bacterium]
MEENKALYIRVQNIIKDAKIKKYVKESDAIAQEGVSFFGNFTGKNSLQLERMKNVKLKIELLQSEKIKFKDTYEKIDMMADLYACAISELGGNFTNEMQRMYDTIKEKCAEETIIEGDIHNLARKKIEKGQSYLPVIHQEKPKGIFGDIKMQIEFYKIENKKLENQIILERGKSQFGTFDYIGRNAGIIIPVNIRLEKINFLSKH